MDILEILKKLGGYWKYNGGRYLAETDEDKVTDTIIDCSVLTSSPRNLSGIATTLKYRLKEAMGINPADIDTRTWYVCGTNDSRELAYAVARDLDCKAIYTEPVYEALSCDDGDDTGFVPHYVEKTGQQLNFKIPKGTTVLFVEDVITTFESITGMFRAMSKVLTVLRPDVIVLPYVLCLVNCSGEKTVPEFEVKGTEPIHGGQEIISLAEASARTWDTTREAEFDLIDDEQRASMGFNAVGGLKAVFPKTDWDKLVGKDK